MERRPILLSSVMLRQNPHNVHEWHKRVKLFNGQPHKQILTYTEAVTTVDVDMVSNVTLTVVHSGRHPRGLCIQQHLDFKASLAKRGHWYPRVQLGISLVWHFLC